MPTVDNCGEVGWELAANFYGHWDEGPYTQSGTCTGGYINCNCDNVPLSFRSPTAPQFHPHLMYWDNNSAEYEWWWDIYNYEGQQIFSCDSGPCAGTGSYESDQQWLDSNAGWDDVTATCRY